MTACTITRIITATSPYSSHAEEEGMFSSLLCCMNPCLYLHGGVSCTTVICDTDEYYDANKENQCTNNLSIRLLRDMNPCSCFQGGVCGVLP